MKRLNTLLHKKEQINFFIFLNCNFYISFLFPKKI